MGLAEHDTETAGADDDDLVGRTFGKYEIVRLLGVGGMGRVYEGVHEAGKISGNASAARAGSASRKHFASPLTCSAGSRGPTMRGSSTAI